MKPQTGSILEHKGMRAIFQKKGKENGKKEQNIWKFGQKCTKFENFLKNTRIYHGRLFTKSDKISLTMVRTTMTLFKLMN